MERTELENSRAQEAELLRQFEPEAAQLRDLCKRLLEAVRATRRPDLSRLDTADALYQEYVARVGGLYGKALPVLRDAIAALSKVARCEVPPSWPDALPFAAHLPDDLITSPVPESLAVQQLGLLGAAVLELGALHRLGGGADAGGSGGELFEAGELAGELGAGGGHPAAERA